LAPRRRRTKDRTAGVKAFSTVGRINSFKALRLIPVRGHRWPGCGNRRNSGRGAISSSALRIYSSLGCGTIGATVIFLSPPEFDDSSFIGAIRHRKPKPEFPNYFVKNIPKMTFVQLSSTTGCGGPRGDSVRLWSASRAEQQSNEAPDRDHRQRSGLSVYPCGVERRRCRRRRGYGVRN
jgi:hypothetical protein